MDTKSNTVIPFFTIVIPTLNEEKYLPQLLTDLKKQTFKDFAVTVVDAKSVDRTVKSAEKFKNSFVSFSIIQSNEKNVSYQRNIGAEKANSGWIIFMDADNRIPNYFLQGIKFDLELHNPDILTTWLKPDTNNKKDAAVATLMNIFMDLQKTSKTPYLLESFILIKKELFEKLNGFDKNILWGEGNDLIKHAAKMGAKYVIVKEPKYSYSFRRLRKRGTLKVFRNSARLEITQLINKRIPREKARYLYPMEGGQYFEIDEEKRSKFKLIFQKIFKETQNNNDIRNKNNFLYRVNKLLKDSLSFKNNK